MCYEIEQSMKFEKVGKMKWACLESTRPYEDIQQAEYTALFLNGMEWTFDGECDRVVLCIACLRSGQRSDFIFGGVYVMNSRRTKIIVDIFMTAFLILSLIRWDGMGGFIYHAIVGTACALFFSLHMFIHRKWIKAVTKSCFAGKLSKALRWKYIIDMLLLMFWGVSILTGFIAIIPFLGEAESLSVWGRLHGVTARIGLALIIIHAIQHLPQIKSYLGIKKRTKHES